ncbi:hypothetical protein BDN72DRAFT_746728, partial [Pluteus cervinus]
LRTQHIPLNAYLHRFKRADSPYCKSCIKSRLYLRETVTHYLFECPAWKSQRDALRRRVECGMATTLKSMLSDEETTKELITFIHETRRFITRPGDV